MKGLIIPQNIKDFNNSTVGDYIEQKEMPNSASRSPGLSIRGDAVPYNNIDLSTISEHQGTSEDCGCGGGSKGISFEYKILVVLILIIMIWTFISWRHHHMVSH